jgi:hypothetical protein
MFDKDTMYGNYIYRIIKNNRCSISRTTIFLLMAPKQTYNYCRCSDILAI